MAEKIRDTVADQAFTEWTANMEEHIRHSGPVYQTYAQNVVQGLDRVVNDGWSETNDLPYGPWLEGVGSRNSPVTIFPGYHSLEDAYTTTDEQVDELAEPIVDEYVEKING